MTCPQCLSASPAGAASCPACAAPLLLPDDPPLRPIDRAVELDRRQRVRDGAAAVAARVGGPPAVAPEDDFEPPEAAPEPRALPARRLAIRRPEGHASAAMAAAVDAAELALAGGDFALDAGDLALDPAESPEPDAALSPEPGEVRLSCAPLERRALAWAIDGAVVLAGALGPVALAARALPTGADAVAALLAPAALLTGLAAFAYAALGLCLMGATPGQRLLGLRVAGPDGGAPGLARAGIRAALAVLGTGALGLGLLPAIFTSSGRGLHDLAARTVVVRAP